MWGPACAGPLAVAPILRSQRYNGLRQRTFVSARNNTVTLHATRLADDPAGLTLRETVLLSNPINRLPAQVGAYKFPEAMSFNTCFSSDRSAITKSLVSSESALC